MRTAAPALSAALPAPPVESSEEDEEIPDESRLLSQGLGPNLRAWDCSGIVIYKGLGVEYGDYSICWTNGLILKKLQDPQDLLAWDFWYSSILM